MLIQDVVWPGVIGTESCTGTISHGISPSTFVLVTAPQVARPQVFGDLVLRDGTHGAVNLRGCKLSHLTGRTDSGGQSYVLEIQDRRWRWQGAGAVSGRFNRLEEKNGKLVPWSLRSPFELAVICLQALGEPAYEINLPIGLSKKDGADLDRYLRLGENFKQSLANPPQTWDYSPPAEVLARLADYFGCRVIYQPTQDRILIASLGEGAALPNGPSDLIVPAIKIPDLPAGIGVAGAVRIQARFQLEAVGLEWDDTYLPINDVSYAPRRKAATQITTLTYVGTAVMPPALTVRFDWQPLTGGPDQTVRFIPAGNTIAAVWAGLQSLILTEPLLAAIILPSYSGSVFQFTGNGVGQAFSVTFTQGNGQANFAVVVAQVGRPGGGDWSTCPPPSFAGALETDRLSRLEVLQRARQSVFKCYRLKLVNPLTGKPPFKLPWFGTVKRRQQILLQDKKVEQVVPQARVAGGTNQGALLPEGQLSGGILPEFYGGFSRSQNAVVYGAVSRFIGSVTWIPFPLDGGSPHNTRPSDRVYVDFAFNPFEQLITFSDYVYATDFSGGGSVRAASLILETGCLVCDYDTDQIVRWTWERPLAGGAPKLWQVHDDAEVGIVGTYVGPSGPNLRLQLHGYTTLNKADADARANYALDAMMIPLQLTGGDVRQYPGILPIDVDGAIQQITWRVGPEGPSTTASRNSEHSPNVPAYPARRLKENLPPNQAAKAANAIERADTEKRFGRK